jgi:cellulose synthase/poly-beta-1,6-N-acetylglucosamine synthase-like glycosyltransferase
MLTTTISIALLAVTGLLAIPVVVIAVQVFSAMVPSARFQTPMASVRPKVAVLVPAHDEASGIAATCMTLGDQLGIGDRLLVVADNCSDDTATVARNAGAEVIERRDPARRGKGYALDFGVRHLEEQPPDIVLVVDADCLLTEGSLDILVRACAASSRPVQATYSMRNHQVAPLRLRIAEFAGIVKNLVRPLGYRRLGLPCQLMGTGMAFPWSVIARAELATGHIVEDMKLGTDLAYSGAAPVYCPEAEVISYFPASAVGLRTQRTRWEHGHLSVIFSAMPRLLTKAVQNRNIPLLAMALDLAVPPLALLALLIIAAQVAAVILALSTGITTPLWLTTAVLALLSLTVIAAWGRFARSALSARDLVFAPIYALLKIPMYLRFFYAKQAEWIRSSRDEK